MSDAILNTIILSITSIVVAIIGVGQWRNNKRTKEIKGQVVNSHSDKPGLREDIDELKSGMKFIQRDVGGLREETRQVRREVYEQSIYGQQNRSLIHKLQRKLERTEVNKKGKEQ